MTSLTYEDVIHEYQRLNLSFALALETVLSLFPEQIEEAIALWKLYEAYKLGFKNTTERLQNNVIPFQETGICFEALEPARSMFPTEIVELRRQYEAYKLGSKSANTQSVS
ncbi:MAG: hypothetical protein MUC48_04985 [Leptolyngbya sp. Prado105]|jgi:hypothetical protein|nr:hypothetical protein [Leptolyngbya sp. Prado105]